MNILKLELTNFRSFESAAFQFNPEFTILIGDNAKGKTSVLDAIAKLLLIPFYPARQAAGPYPPAIKDRDVRLKSFKYEDVITGEKQYPVIIMCEGEYKGETVKWQREIDDTGQRKTNMEDSLHFVFKSDFIKAQNGEEVLLSLISYYGVKRMWPATNSIMRSTKKDTDDFEVDSRMDGYIRSLMPTPNQSLLYKWFKKYELAALQENKQFRILESIRESVRKCVPDCRRFFYEVKTDMLMIDLDDGQRIPFDYLSDGYRNMVAMVADIAHRAARLNPHLGEGAAEKTPGVVLIDEIDLHLHPKWQRSVVNSLRNAFPKIQFIATTHSPFIIQSMEDGEVIDLNSVSQPMIAPGDFATPAPSSEYSDRSIEDIVEDVMGIPVPQRSKRYEEMMNTAKEYYKLLKQGEGASEQKLDALRIELDKLSAPFSDNPAYHAFLEMEAIAAGLGERNNGSKRNGEATDETGK